MHPAGSPTRAEAALEERLREIAGAGLYRSLSAPAGVDFASNDYLGLSRHPDLRARVAEHLARLQADGGGGAPASRLLRGHTLAHEALETRLAHFKGAQTALLFSNGYMANVGLLSSVLGPNDRVLSDAQNHASIIDGIRLSKAQKIIFPHLSRVALQRHLATPFAGGQTFVVTESLFGMDGDIAPLADYLQLCEQYDAALIVDDAHGTGVYGAARRSGLTENADVARRAFAVTSTCGKALGTFGAFVTGSAVLKRFLINAARPFIFSTAVPTMLLAAIHASLDVLADAISLGATAQLRAQTLRLCLQAHGLSTGTSAGPVVPVVVGDNTRAMALAADVRHQGYDVRAIRPPTVAPGTARLRLSVHADHSMEEITGVAHAIAAAFKKHRQAA